MKSFAFSKVNAFYNVVTTKKQGASLPDRVLEGNWSSFFFFGDDTIFGSFATRVRELLRIEGSHTCCIVDFKNHASPKDRVTKPLDFQNAATIFIDAETSESAYLKEMNLRRPHFSWVASMGDYGCSSDLGDWYVYTERTNEVSFIAFRDVSAFERYGDVVKSIGAQTVDEFCRPGSHTNPYSGLNRVWKDGLLQNYRNGSVAES